LPRILSIENRPVRGFFIIHHCGAAVKVTEKLSAAHFEKEEKFGCKCELFVTSCCEEMPAHAAPATLNALKK
jgi:hypothetical protein